MLGAYVDLGNPVSSHPLNHGLTGLWVGHPPWLRATGWAGLVAPARRSLAAAGTVSDARVYGGTVAPFLAVGGTGSGGCFGVTGLASGELSPANTFTWEVFFQHRTASTYQALVSGGATGTAFFRVNNADQINVLLSQQADMGSTSATLTVGRWYHVCFAVAAAGSWTLYLNGASALTGGNPGWGASTAFYLGIENGSFNPAKGAIGGAAVFAGRCLTASDAAGRADQWRVGLPDLLRRWKRPTGAFAYQPPAPAFNPSWARGSNLFFGPGVLAC